VSNPALTRPIVVIVVALDDCTISVTKAPQNALDSGVAAAVLSVVRSPGPASALRPLVMTLMPSRNRPTPPRTEIVVDMRPLPGAATVRLFNRTQRTGDVSPRETFMALQTTARIRRYLRARC
jgi:hypothetical protein